MGLRDRLKDVGKRALSSVGVDETGDTLRWDDYYRGPAGDQAAQLRFMTGFATAVRLEAEGSAALHIGALQQAERAFDECAATGEQLRVRELVARGREGRMRVAEKRGERAEMRRWLEAAIAAKGPERDATAITYGARAAMLDYEEGRLTEADAALTALVDEVVEPASGRLRYVLCRALIDRATVRRFANRWEDALADCDAVEAHAGLLKLLGRQAVMLNVQVIRTKVLSTPWASVHDLAAAEAAAAAMPTIGAPRWLGMELRSDLAHLAGRWEEAEQASLQAAEAMDAQGWHEAAMTLRTRAAECRLELADPDAAAELAAAARDAFAQMGAEERLASATMLLARARSAQGRHEEACALAETALAHAERRIRHFTVLGEQQRFIVDKLRDYGHAITVALRAGEVLRAWAAAERAKSFYLCQIVAGAQISPPTGTAAALREVEDALDVEERAHPARGRDNEAAARIAGLQARRDALLTEVMRQDPGWAAGRVPPPFDLGAELARLVSRWAPVSYHWQKTTLHVFATDADGSPMHVTIDWNEEELAALRGARAALRGVVPPFAPVLPAALGPKLLPPKVLGAAVGRALLLSPGGELVGVPLHAADPDGRGPLAARMEVQMIPTLALLRARRQAPSGDGVLLLGAPETPHHPRRLGNVPEELDALEQVWAARRPGAVIRRVLGPEDTPRAAGVPVEAWDRFGVVHLACHGEVPDGGDPLDAALLLGGDRLRASELFTAQLPADVVALSACAVGRRAETYAGLEVVADEWIGMVLPLLRAGARTVVASLWDANSDVAARFMAALHDALADGAPPEKSYARAVAAVADYPAPLWLNWYVVGYPDMGGK